ncbi:MAG: DNA cytosine methyltransferase [Ekhidna sp.]|nr:DNA cytosine methyltransferase [Ekhidna sp.]
MKIISLFSGCGGLDLGFKNAGFKTIWANDNANSVWETFEKNFPGVYLSKKSLVDIKSDDIPDDFLGIVGGPPCQAWSNAGNGKGFGDKRGALFLDFIRIIDEKKPLFFVAENVEGILSKRNIASYEIIKETLENAGDGYNLSIKVLNAANFGVPQNRKRVFIVGYKKEMNRCFIFPKAGKIETVKKHLWDLRDNALPAVDSDGNKTNGTSCVIPNHEYWLGSYSYIFMSRNRVLSWDEPSYTIQASGRQTSIHPSAPKMVKVEKDVMKFVEKKVHLYRRLSVRECARIQTFPDDFLFYYDSLNSAYKMIGNSVPVNLAYSIAEVIYKDISSYQEEISNRMFHTIDTIQKSIQISV